MKKLLFLLPVFSFLACQQTDKQPTTDNPSTHSTINPKADPAILSLFEEVNVVKMQLFGTNEADPNPEYYPYTGKAITGEGLKYLAQDLQPNDIGGVFGCYFIENSGHFILRVPGKYASSDLALAKWDDSAKQLVKEAEVAYSQCDEGYCHLQNAWLTDLDDSRTLELVIRKHTRDPKGTLSDETFEVLTDDGTGHFTKTNEQLASLAVKENYVMK